MLSDRYEDIINREDISSSVLAYRAGRDSVECAKEVITFFRAHPDFQVSTFDVEKFYETIDHVQLKNRWASLLGVSRIPDDHFRVFSSLTRFRFVRKGRLRKLKFEPYDGRLCSIADYRNKVVAQGLLEPSPGVKKGVGIPQGAPISCVLSNAYMLDLDIAITRAVQSVDGMYRRYADDMIIICPRKNAKDIENLLEEEIKKLGLNLQRKKTERRILSPISEDSFMCIDTDTGNAKPLRYLGIEFTGDHFLLRHAGIARFQRRRFWVIQRKAKKYAFIPKDKRYWSFVGERNNYPAYAKRAADILDSETIRRQVNQRRNIKQIKMIIIKEIEKWRHWLAR